jgi:uncharacterized LabA/DUF88 family protein
MQPIPSNGARNESPKKDVAVYIDYENLYISLRSTIAKNPGFDVIMEKCREFGRCTVARAYADWSEFARVVTSQLFASGVEPVYVPTRKFYDARTRSQATKNSVDIHITIDIMKDVLLSKNIDIFVLVSGDRDFVPLMNQIRAAGKEVYGIGVAGCTSSELAVAVDEMFYYHQLLETDEEQSRELADVYGKLVRAIEIARARGYRATLGVVKPILREIVVGFDERKVRNAKGVPFQKFKDFVLEAERLGFIKCSTAGESLELLLAKDDVEGVRRQADDRSAAARGRPAPPPRRVVTPTSTDDADKAPAPVLVTEGGDESEEQAAAGGGATAPAEGGERTGRRRRGRRGGRGRRGRGGEAAAAQAGSGNGASDADRDADAKSDEDVAAEAPEADAEETVEASADDARTDEASGLRSWAGRLLTRGRGADEAGGTAIPEADEDEGGDEDADVAGGSDLTLPDEAYDDLRLIMDTFRGRAPSQRLLIARLKKGAQAGELKGRYEEGQFLLLVRKAIEDGHLVKVSKRFSSGLRWASGESAAGAE